MNILQRAALLAAIGVAAIVAAGAYTTAPAAQAALGGPVILGGDDLTDHGCYGEGANVNGWLYMQRALENIKPNVTRSNDGSVAALGSEDVGGAVICDNAGSAIFHAAAEAGLGTVNYHEGATAINDFFAALAAGSATPKIIWIAGTGASNDLNTEESDALTANAAAISAFVSSGGGLMSHGTAYGWLFALLPDASTVDSGCDVCDDLYFTPDGLVALPALTVGDINAGPWHNHFEGDLGGLKVLVRSTEVLDGLTDADAAVVIGGAQVTFEKNPEPPAPEPTATPKACIPPLIGITCTAPSGGGGSGGSAPTATAVAATPAPASTVVAPTPAAPAQTQPSGGQAGVIVAPDTGDGSGTAGGGSASLMLLALATAGIALAGAGAMKLQARRD